jgi:ankyrin repeat protein
MKDKIILSSFALLLTLSGCSTMHKEINKQTKPYKYTPLHTAVRLNQLSAVENILQKDNSMINISDNFGDTPLVDAVRYNYTNIVKVLICNGAKTNIKDIYDLQPLDNAIKNNNQVMVKMLTDPTLSFCQEDTLKDTDTPELDVIQTNNEEIEGTFIKNMVFDPTSITSPKKEQNIQKSELDNYELSNEELEQYINDTQTLGNL